MLVSDYARTNICYSLYVHDSLSNLIFKISYQWIVFTTAYCITNQLRNLTFTTNIFVDLLLNAFHYHLISLRYKPEGRVFNSRWCYWNFSLT